MVIFECRFGFHITNIGYIKIYKDICPGGVVLRTPGYIRGAILPRLLACWCVASQTSLHFRGLRSINFRPGWASARPGGWAGPGGCAGWLTQAGPAAQLLSVGMESVVLLMNFYVECSKNHIWRPLES